MEYLFVGIGRFIVGGVVAWALLSSRAQAALRAKLEAAERQLTDHTTELTVLRSKQRQDADALQPESEGRAATEQIAARVSGLETRLAEAQKLGAADKARLAEIETCVFVSARRFRDLGSAPEGVEIANIEPLDHAPRASQAVELATAETLVADEANVE